MIRSPDKDVNFPCTTAAFTLPPEPVGFVVLCQLAQGLSLMRFLSPGSGSGQAWLARLPSGFLQTVGALLPLPLVCTFGSIHYEHPRLSYKGLSPHQFTPMAGVHKRVEASVDSPVV